MLTFIYQLTNYLQHSSWQSVAEKITQN